VMNPLDTLRHQRSSGAAKRNRPATTVLPS
jgi:hypothetical protein